MLKPSINDLLEIMDSRYTLVIAASKRAREIIQDESEQEDPSTIKPVSRAIDEIYTGKLEILTNK